MRSLLASIGCGGVVAIFAFIIANIAAWMHHVIFTIQHHEYILLLVGALVPFIGAIHGWGLWLGWFTY